MLRCRRTEAYLSALGDIAQSHIRGKAVLDVGCGSGVLAMACARLGARAVYAVEASEMAMYARQIVKDNGLDSIVKVHHCSAEELSLPEEVDIVVSEWMGSFLLYERMLPAVLLARDKWLKRGSGMMFPSRARLWIAPYRDDGIWDDISEFWASPIHGFDMSAMLPLAKAERTDKPLITLAAAENVMAGATLLVDIDLVTVTYPGPAARGAPLVGSFSVKTHVATDAFVGFVGWFDTQFYPDGPWLDTSPYKPPTHWQQVKHQ
mmetsp:Transcript_24753/g.75427  ORF Transcript_24753/g.75427 Transcript_24753/m.75427 type:complete len:263 (+) Transcript_24753:261-1049(+)